MTQITKPPGQAGPDATTVTPVTRVLVVEDSVTMRKRLVEILAEAPGLEVIGEAADGREAIDLCERLRPDVVTLDMQLPDVSGLDATEHIMAYCPTPILIVSSSVNRGEVFKTYDALAAGAVDVLEKPRGDELDGVWEQRLVSAVRLVARIRVITHPRARLPRRVEPTRNDSGPTGSGRDEARQEPVRTATLVAIGISTGGPAAIVQLLSQLGRDFPAPVLIVLHISPLFASALVDWLDPQSPLPVRLARDGERIPRTGVALLAPPDKHLVVRGDHLVLLDAPERHSCRPSVDTLFESLAGRPRTVACLMTGMGRDGAEGLLRIRQAGGITIAQDEASSIVFGMPREAIRLGAAERVLSLDEIPRALLALCRAGGAS